MGLDAHNTEPRVKAYSLGAGRVESNVPRSAIVMSLVTIFIVCSGAVF